MARGTFAKSGLDYAKQFEHQQGDHSGYICHLLERQRLDRQTVLWGSLGGIRITYVCSIAFERLNQKELQPGELGYLPIW